MKFDDLDAKMRVFETAHDYCVVPGVFLVVRLDGRSFTRLTKETHRFEAPFDERFRDMMLGTVEHVMNCGMRVVYGYTQSDEISLLFHRDDNSFGRKTRKLNSVLAGETSARFSLLLGDVGCFDSRVCELPTEQLVVDYFRWRHEDAHRNALNVHCYWLFRKRGLGQTEATERLLGLSVADKNELLFQAGVNFNDLPGWQKRGSAVWWRDVEKVGLNPKTGEQTVTTRRRLSRDLELPMKDAYDAFVRERVAEAQASHAAGAGG
ncbi:MAG TPA: tRNA(His) guanylyltransferase Thg1 family protein [Humisphaera sp.]